MIAGEDQIAQLLERAERRLLKATLILDVQDVYASGRRIAGGVVRAMGPLRFSFTARDPGTATPKDIDPPLALTTIANPSGYHLWFGACADSRPDPGPGTYQLRIDSSLYAPFQKAVTSPQPGSAVVCTLIPGRAYPFPGGGLVAPGVAGTLLRGVLQNADGTGQANGTVTLHIGGEPPTYLTDASGEFVFWIPDPVPATVSVTVAFPSDGPPAVSLPSVAITAGTEVKIPQTVLTGQIVATATGGTVSLARPNASVLADADGNWRMVLPLDQKSVRATVTAQVGGQQQKKTVQIRAGQSTPVPTFVFD